jgi:double stranded RNA-specific editase B
MQLQVDDRYFYACGSSKKLAKVRCAQTALESLFSIKLKTDNVEDKNFKQFADAVDNRIQEAIVKLKFEIDNDILKQHYVYAAIVQTDNHIVDDQTKVVCVTTGTKCINGEYMSQMGNSLNDSHAEILAIRSLRLYLYEQLETCCSHLIDKQVDKLDDDDACIFAFDMNSRRFRLKEAIKFHLYISTTPCGDGL